MLTWYMCRRFAVVEIRIGKIREMRFYLIFSFLRFKVVDKRMMNLFKGNEHFEFSCQDFRYSIFSNIISNVFILDQKLYDNPIQEIISNTSKFEKLNEDPILILEASLQPFLGKLKQKKSYGLSCFLCDLLSPIVSDDYPSKDTFFCFSN